MGIDYNKLKQGLSCCLVNFHPQNCAECPYMKCNLESETGNACRYRLYIDFSIAANDMEGSRLLEELRICLLNKNCTACAYYNKGKKCTTFLYKKLAFYLRKGIFENDEKKN